MTSMPAKKIALVTGAARGIGEKIANALSTNVDALVLVDIDVKQCEKVAHAILEKENITCLSYHCDIGDTTSVHSLLSEVASTIGNPTILINNAGIGGPFHRVDEVSDDEWYKIMNTNLKSVFNFSRYLLPKMKAEGYGRIVNIASVQGFLGAALSSTYVASKHGVIGYTRAIAAEWGAYGILCNAVCPGYVDTSMGVQSDKVSDHHVKVMQKTPLGRVAKPDEIANLVKYLIIDNTFVNGSVLTIDGGLTCHVGVS